MPWHGGGIWYRRSFYKAIQRCTKRRFYRILKRTGKGVLGLVVTPVTATLRVGQSLSQGIAGSDNALGNLGKTRMELMDV